MRPLRSHPLRGTTTLVASLGLALLSQGACQRPEPARPPAPLAAQERRHAPGSAPAFRAELVPDAVEKTAAGGAMTVRVELEALPEFTTGRTFVGLYAADGHVVHEQKSRNFALHDGHAELTVAWPALADGFYLARLTAVGTDGEDDASSVSELHLEVHDGDVETLDVIDWFDRSGTASARPATTTQPGVTP